MPPSYAFKNPSASSIYPNLNPHETLSILHKINASRPAEKRLPTEILLYINEEVHAKEVHPSGNALANKIRDRWTPLNGEINPHSYRVFFKWKEPVLNLKEERYYRIDEPAATKSSLDFRYGMRHESQDGTIIEHISSADLLYRLRCCFPEIPIDRDHVARYVWVVHIKHNQSGLLLKFYDYEGTASLIAFLLEDINLPHPLSRPILDVFAADVLLLMSILYETVDGSRRLVYYHPAAIADLHSDNEQGFIAVPRYKPRRRRDEKSESVYRTWRLTEVSAADVSSFESILHDFKYDISSNKLKLVGLEDTGVNLTTVISSALLFYRLICKFKRPVWHDGRYENVYTIPLITSVWQVQLTHETGYSIILMDDRGLFDIRVHPETKQLVEIAQNLKRTNKMLNIVFEKSGIIKYLAALIEVLCGDNCAYKGTS